MTQADALESRAPRWRHLARLLLAVTVVQLVFWLAVRPALFAKPTMPPLYALSGVEEAELASPDEAGLAAARFTPAELPWSACCGPGYRALRFDVEIPVVPAGGVALVPGADADSLLVRINGAAVIAPVRLALPRPTYEVNTRRVHFLPASVFHAGRNRVEYVMVRGALPYYDVGRPVFAEYAVARPLFAWREFVLTDFEMIGAAIGALIALFALLLLRRSSERGLAVALLVLAGAWTLITQYYFWVDPPFSPLGRLDYYFALVNLLPLAWLNFADRWTRRSVRWIAPLSVLAYATCIAATSWALRALPAPDGFDRASDIANWFGLALSAATVVRFVWHSCTSDDDRVLESAIFALCVTLLAVDAATEVIWDDAGGYVIRSLPLLLLAFVAAFVARNVRLFQSTNEINQLLTVRLADREAELAETYRRESELVRREAHQEERQRLMRDMHDGVGGQLTSMLFAARRGGLPPEQLAESLQTVIDEIRLLIDSMDSTTDSLATAIDSFQRRAAPRLEAAGVSLQWRPVSPGLLPALGPREVLQVVRVLQEAVTNALRHARARSIALEITATDDAAFPVQLEVRDDGAGFGAQSSPGRGFANMRSRAESIGARLAVSGEASGAIVRLLLPARGTAGSA